MTGSRSHIAAVLALIGAGAGAAADELACGDLGVTVAAETEALGVQICDHVEAAFAILGACDLPRPDPGLRIETVSELRADCVGLFHCGEALIEVLTPEQLAEKRSKTNLFAEIPLAEYFRSVVLHEVVHAAYDGTDCPYDDCPATAEYLAYALQIGALSPEHRAPFEAGGGAEAQVPRDAINAMVLFMAPDRFAMRAWQHYSQREDPCGYLQGIFSGVTVFDHAGP
ncbi:DUF6639 family protein [Litorisediminicola beolgyonensis]|uniref:DUF6639 family protein n=1 Tax=Litorisediminicola beolgyonensis TaxID=1173614 RepID=A0ABW3ZN91_9RHOB